MNTEYKIISRTNEIIASFSDETRARNFCITALGTENVDEHVHFVLRDNKGVEIAYYDNEGDAISFCNEDKGVFESTWVKVYSWGIADADDDNQFGDPAEDGQEDEEEDTTDEDVEGAETEQVVDKVVEEVEKVEDEVLGKKTRLGREKTTKN